MQNIVVRKAKETDAAQMAETYIKAWKAAYAHILPTKHVDRMQPHLYLTAFRELIKDNQICVLVAQQDETTNGFAVADPNHENFKGELVSLYTDPDFWGKGTGQTLLEHAVNYLRESNCETAFLWVMEDNARARRFYERNNWIRSAETRERNREEKTITDLKYTLNLQQN